MRPGFEIDHIGVAVKSIEESLGFYKSLGFTSVDREEVASEKVKVAFVRFQNQANVELLEATSPESPVAKFIQKRGEGIHHICFRVKNIRSVVAQLKKEGIHLINEEPRKGAHQCEVVFVHPKSCSGVLVELSERMPHG